MFYGRSTISQREKGVQRSVKDEMSYFNLPDAVQKVIRESLQEMGKNENEHKVDSYALLLEQAEGLKDLNEAELCGKFGLDPETLQKEFSHLFSNILHVFKFLKTGNVEALYQDSEKLNPVEILDNEPRYWITRV